MKFAAAVFVFCIVYSVLFNLYFVFCIVYSVFCIVFCILYAVSFMCMSFAAAVWVLA